MPFLTTNMEIALWIHSSPTDQLPREAVQLNTSPMKALKTYETWEP